MPFSSSKIDAVDKDLDGMNIEGFLLLARFPIDTDAAVVGGSSDDKFKELAEFETEEALELGFSVST